MLSCPVLECEIDMYWSWCFEVMIDIAVYQPKATTLTCVLVRMVVLELILEYPFPNQPSLSIIEYKYKATNIHKYFTPYACFVSTSSAYYTKCKVNSIHDATHLVLVIPSLPLPEPIICLHGTKMPQTLYTWTQGTWYLVNTFMSWFHIIHNVIY